MIDKNLYNNVKWKSTVLSNIYFMVLFLKFKGCVNK